MDAREFYGFQVRLIDDKETGQVIAAIPTLDIADYGANSQQALQRLKKMAVFHLECLMEEGKPVPQKPVAGD